MSSSPNQGSAVKGVILCKRPGGGGGGGGGGEASGPGSRAPAAKGAGGGRKPFVACAVSSPVGVTPLRSEIIRVAEPVKKKGNEANARHRKWLAQLQQARRQVVDELNTRAVAEERVKARLREKQARRRVEIRGSDVPPCWEEKVAAEGFGSTEFAQFMAEQKLKMQNPRLYEQHKQQQQPGAVPQEAGPPGDGGDVAFYNDGRRAPASPSTAREAEPRTRSVASPPTRPSTQGGGQRRKTRGGGGAAKPAWALTAEQNEAREEETAEDLLDFAESLDLDTFLEGVEANVEADAQARLEEAERRAAAADEAEEGAEDEDGDEGDSDDEAGERGGAEGGAGGEGGEALRRPGTAGSVRAAAATATASPEGRRPGTASGSRAEWNARGGPDGRDLDAERKLLASSRSIRSVHSAASVRAVMNQALSGPRIATIQENGRVEDEAQHLPYLYRHPAM